VARNQEYLIEGKNSKTKTIRTICRRILL